MQDIAQFSTILRPPIIAALELLGDSLATYDGPAGERLYDVPGGPLPPEDAAAPPRLLPMWESTLLAYANRSRIIPPAYRTVIARNNGDLLPTLLVDGLVAGVWRPVAEGIEAMAFHGLADDAWDALEDEARGLLAFLGTREPLVYSRYGHWWTKGLPRAEVRVIGR